MTDQFEDCILAAQSELAVARRLLSNEISAYPVPISGCDAQFNHLLAERQKVLLAIRSLEEDVFIPTPRAPTAADGVESR
ncbi:hypothetical protein [uncultured Roseobacter sp.]|uniref:hypothetical protein n=1 Tax=uncultured Roseobacter sp. TaxID=114847 RepID=UPI002607F85D|nr:hypothetical protein [uncultured Roseobacter sp.]